MANEKIIFDTEVKVGNSVGSVKSLKAELRAITNELGQLEVGSDAFVKAAQKAGDLQDRIGDVKNTIAAFNPEAKFKAFADTVGIAANGFSAVQGAMALMGSESEDLNKIMVKTQGAIALATGLNGLLGMGPFPYEGEENPDLASMSLILIINNSSKKEKQKEKE
jgi:hypothetical protein